MFSFVTWSSFFITLISGMMISGQLNAQIDNSDRRENAREEQRKKYRENEDQMLKALREKMRKDHEMMNRLLNDDLFANLNHSFHQRFKKLLDDFYQGPPDDFFNNKKFDQFFREWPPHNFDRSQFDSSSDDLDDSQWIDGAGERTLVLKLDIPKDSPLDIKIEKGIIHVSGKTKRHTTSSSSTSRGETIEEEMQFQKAFPVPSDCIASSALFENEDGQIKIRLRKKSNPNQLAPTIPTPSGIKPLAPKQGDITL